MNIIGSFTVTEFYWTDNDFKELDTAWGLGVSFLMVVFTPVGACYKMGSHLLSHLAHPNWYDDSIFYHYCAYVLIELSAL